MFKVILLTRCRVENARQSLDAPEFGTQRVHEVEGQGLVALRINQCLDTEQVICKIGRGQYIWHPAQELLALEINVRHKRVPPFRQRYRSRCCWGQTFSGRRTGTSPGG